MIKRFSQSFKLAATGSQNELAASPAPVEGCNGGDHSPARSIQRIGTIAADLALALTAAEWDRIKDTNDIACLMRFASYFPGYYGELAYERASALDRERRHYASWYWANEQKRGQAYIREFPGAAEHGFALAAHEQYPSSPNVEVNAAGAVHSVESSAELGLDGLIQNARSRVANESAGRGNIFRDSHLAPELVAIPAGSFVMGSDDEDAGPFEKPVRQVTLSNPIAVGRFPVTFDDWYRAVDAGAITYAPNDEGWGGGRRPIVNVSWHNAKLYSAWLSHITGYTYRLLTEAEWEYCCRSGSKSAYATGEEIGPNQAQFSIAEWGSAGQTCEVGNFAANGFGLYDMHGNVAEWVEDVWASSYGAAGSDGSAFVCENPIARVTRGGGWPDRSRSLRSASRNRLNPSTRNNSTGFRIARTLVPPT